MRWLVALIVGAACSAVAVAAEDADATWRMEARALDATTQMRQSRSRPNSDAVVLPGVDIHVQVRAPGLDPWVLEAHTDGKGIFSLEGRRPPPGASVDFVISPEREASGRPALYARPWRVDDGPAPRDVSFYEVATDSDAVYVERWIQVVTTIDRDESQKAIELRSTAMVVNAGDQVWFGDAEHQDPTTFAMPCPPGFRLMNVTLDGQDMSPDVDRLVHGGEGYVYRTPIFPTAGGRPMLFVAMFSAPYEKGRTVDLSWHAPLAVDEYLLNIQEDAFTYIEPGEDAPAAALADGGVNGAMGNRQIVTHSWGLRSIPAHADLSARLLCGTRFPWRPTLWVAAIALLVAGAGALGVAASRVQRRHSARTEPPAASVPPDEQAHELELLGRRLQRREISQFEYEARRAAIEGRIVESHSPAGHDTAATAGQPRSRERLLAETETILAHVDAASPKQLRKDVRTLARTVRELLQDG